jgi:MoaA/NifB/PqqE/SkfB family radical SAM enzyme
MLEDFFIKRVANLVKNKKEISDRDIKIISAMFKFFPIPYTSRKGENWQEYKKNQLNEIKENFLKKKGWTYGFPQRILKEWHPNCKEKFIKNFLLLAWTKKKKIREKVEKEGSFTPMSVLISPLMRCNYRCVGCYAQNYTKADDMPEEIFERIVKEGEEMGVVIYTILGGEPFLIFDRIYRIFKKYNDTAYAQVFTNASLITQDIAKRLQELGNIFVQFSVEGFEKETDERRGKGAFKILMEKMDLLKKYGIPHGFSVTYTSKNADVVISDEFIDLMIEKGCIWGWYFLYMPVFGEKEDISLMPSPEQRYKLWKRHLEIRSEKPIVTIDFWGDAPLVGGCIAGKYYIHINNKGDVEPCIFTHFAQDNIKNKHLKEIMASPLFKKYREIQPYCQNLLLPCPLIDHPRIIRELVEKFNLYPTHPRAENFISHLGSKIDQYAKRVHPFMDKVWKENYDNSYELSSCPWCYKNKKIQR